TPGDTRPADRRPGRTGRSIALGVGHDPGWGGRVPMQMRWTSPFGLRWVALVLALALVVTPTGDALRAAPAEAADASIASGSPRTDDPTCGTVISVESPAPGAAVSGLVGISGWAVDPNASEGSGVASVMFSLNAPPDQGGIVLGLASYGQDRSDVADQY